LGLGDLPLYGYRMYARRIWPYTISGQKILLRTKEESSRDTLSPEEVA
jgi:hypothetical protein